MIPNFQNQKDVENNNSPKNQQKTNNLNPLIINPQIIIKNPKDNKNNSTIKEFNFTNLFDSTLKETL